MEYHLTNWLYKGKAIYFILFIILVSQSCISKKSYITSGERCEYDKKVKRIFIVIEALEDTAYSSTFAKTLQDGFGEKKVPSQVYIKQKLDLTNDTDFERMISNFQTTHYLVISNKASSRGEISLINFENKKTIWHGFLNIQSRLIRKKSQAKDDAWVVLKELENNYYNLF